nr:hypothetical protein [Rhizobium laguerreae]
MFLPRLRAGQTDIAKLVVGEFQKRAAAAALFEVMFDRRQQPQAPARNAVKFRANDIAGCVKYPA